MMKIKQYIPYVFILALAAGIITLFIQNKRLESKVKEQRHLYVLEKEKRIEANEIAFDSIEELNSRIEFLIKKSHINISNTNASREQNKKDYEKATSNADTITDISFLQRTLSDIFER